METVFGPSEYLDLKYHDYGFQHLPRAIEYERLEQFGCGQDEPLVQLRDRL